MAMNPASANSMAFAGRRTFGFDQFRAVLMIKLRVPEDLEPCPIALKAAPSVIPCHIIGDQRQDTNAHHQRRDVVQPKRI